MKELIGPRLYEETSRKGLGDFPLSERIKGYWDRAGIEIDLVAVSESTRRIRFGTCKRNPAKLMSSLPALRAGAAVSCRRLTSKGPALYWAVSCAKAAWTSCRSHVDIYFSCIIDFNSIFYVKNEYGLGA